jgi:chromosome segregation ATPase
MSHSAAEGTPQDPQLPQTTPAAPAAPAVPEGYFTQDQVHAAMEQARKEAHDRLYGRVEELTSKFETASTELSTFRQREEEREAEAARQRQEAEAEARKAREDEMSAKQLLEEQRREWDDRFKQMEEAAKVREALFQKERERTELLAHIQKRLAEEKDNIAPELIDYIDGTSVEEVEAAITTAKNKTASMLEGIRQASINQRAATPGVSSATGNLGPLDQQGTTRTYTAEEIAALPVGSPEHEQLRQAHGIGRPAGGPGMFG